MAWSHEAIKTVGRDVEGRDSRSMDCIAACSRRWLPLKPATEAQKLRVTKLQNCKTSVREPIGFGKLVAKFVRCGCAWKHGQARKVRRADEWG